MGSADYYRILATGVLVSTFEDAQLRLLPPGIGCVRCPYQRSRTKAETDAKRAQKRAPSGGALRAHVGISQSALFFLRIHIGTPNNKLGLLQTTLLLGSGDVMAKPCKVTKGLRLVRVQLHDDGPHTIEPLQPSAQSVGPMRQWQMPPAGPQTHRRPDFFLAATAGLARAIATAAAVARENDANRSMIVPPLPSWRISAGQHSGGIDISSRLGSGRPPTSNALCAAT